VKKKSESKKGSGCACYSAFVAAITLVLERCTGEYEGGVRGVMHGGISMSNFTAGKRRNKAKAP